MRVLRTIGFWVFAFMAAMSLVAALVNGSSLAPAHLAVAAVFVALAWRCHSSSTKELGRKVKVLAEEAAAFFAEVNARGGFAPVAAQGLVNKASEPYVAVVRAKFCEVSSERVGRATGTRIKVAGMPLLLGASQSRSVESMREAAEGELGLTVSSLNFHGGLRSQSIPLRKITAVEIMRDAFAVAVDGRARPVMFVVPNGILWGQLVKNLASLELQGPQLPTGAQLAVL